MISVVFVAYIIPVLEIAGIAINGIFIVIMTFAANRKIKILPLNILYSVLSSIVFLLAGALSGVVLRLVFEADLSESILNSSGLYILYTILAFFIAFCIARPVGNLLYRRIIPFDDVIKKKLATYILVGAAITLMLFLIQSFLYDILGDTTMLNMLYTLILIICFGFLVFAIFAFTDSLRRKIEIGHKDELLKNLQAYTDSIERMATEVRKFRHDHANLMLGFHEYIKGNDIDNIREYFQKYMLSFSENTAIADSRLDILMRLKIPEAKSILSFKFLYAQQLGIDVHIEISENIDGIDIYNMTDICRIIGILLDNATEACKNADNPVLRFLAFKKDKQIIFIFANTYTSIPPLSQIFEKGFTTKADGHGLGLYTVSQLIAENKNLSLNTLIEEENFIQELNIITD